MMMPAPPPTIPYPTKRYSSLSSKLFPHSLKGKDKGADTKSSGYPSYSQSGYSSYSSLDPPSLSAGKRSKTGHSKAFSSPGYGTPPSPTLFPAWDSALDADTSDGMADDTWGFLSPSVDKSSGKGGGDGKSKYPFSADSSSSYLKPDRHSELLAYSTLMGAAPSAKPPPPFASTPAKTGTGTAFFDSSPYGFSAAGYDGGGGDKSKAPFLAGSKYASRPALSKVGGDLVDSETVADFFYPQPHDSKWGSMGTPDIAISYSPSSAPPPARLESETGAQRLSQRTKALIDLQTSEGSFALDAALAAVVGVSVVDLEGRLGGFVLRGVGMSCDLRSVWATVLAVRVFEMRLAGEWGVWQLVVDKARAWVRWVGLGDADVGELERLAGEVLGV